MKMNKNQALYRALPGCWVHYSDSEKSDDYKYACKVDAWNTKKVFGINEELIKKNIERRVKSFIGSGAKSDDFAFKNLEFVEPALNEGIPDIICSINPSTYYCPKCNTVVSYLKSNQSPRCKTCNIKMNQLQMVYVCECGYAEGVKLNRKEKMSYHSWDKNNQFKFFTEKGAKVEMMMQCPLCGKFLYPKNATDSRLFYSHSGNIVNLYNENFANVLKNYGINAELLMLAKWFNIIDNKKFNEIINSPRDFFEKRTRSEFDTDVLSFAKALGKTPAEIIEMLSNGEENGISTIKKQINETYPLELLTSQLNLITSELMEFDTLKYPKSIISLEDSFKTAKENDILFDEDEVKNLIKKLGISNIQISEAVQIINYAYGFTRLKSCPDGTESDNRLKLKGFDHNKVFISNLETEGILVEISMLKIIDWLKDNDLVSKDLVIVDELEAKKWFIENIKLDTVTHFSSIPCGENVITKVVYSLLHTISHMLIISAGKHSGLSKESISELIFLDSSAIFIYPTSSEGVTLGSISGMFESNLLGFLEDALKDNEICTFDPICMNEQNGACIACTYLSEVNCTHFNKDLSRVYLYGGKNKEILIKKGFWK